MEKKDYLSLVFLLFLLVFGFFTFDRYQNKNLKWKEIDIKNHLSYRRSLSDLSVKSDFLGKISIDNCFEFRLDRFVKYYEEDTLNCYVKVIIEPRGVVRLYTEEIFYDSIYQYEHIKLRESDSNYVRHDIYGKARTYLNYTKDLGFAVESVYYFLEDGKVLIASFDISDNHISSEDIVEILDSIVIT